MAKDVWKKLCKHYEGQGKQTIAQLIGKLFRNTLMDESPMETQLNTMCQKAYILSSLGQPLNNTLVAVAMVISLPVSYATLRTILMSSSDKLTTKTIIVQVLVEERQRQANNSQSALITKGPAQKNKLQRKDKKKSREKCTYFQIPGHAEKDCRKKKAAEEAAKSGKQNEKDKEKAKEKPDLSVKVAHATSSDDTTLQLFVAHEHLTSAAQYDWIVDSGASANMTWQCEIFIRYRTLTPPKQVIIGDRCTINVIGVGRVEINVHTGENGHMHTILQEVYHIPDLSTNLLSVPRLTKQGLEVTFDDSTCKILANGKVVAVAHKRNSLYILQILPSERAQAYILQGPSPSLDPDTPMTVLTSRSLTLSTSLETWHWCLGHINFDSISKLIQKDMVNGIKVKGLSTHNKTVCQPCLEGKQHHNPIPTKSDIINPRVLHHTYSDVCGPMDTISCLGFRYFVTFIDAYSHNLVVKLVKTKDKTFGLTKSYFERAKTKTGERPNYFVVMVEGNMDQSNLHPILSQKGSIMRKQMRTHHKRMALQNKWIGQ